MELLLISEKCCMMSVSYVNVAVGVRTYSAAVWSACEHIARELQVLVEDGSIQLYFAVVAVSDLFPVCSRLRHDNRSCMSTNIWFASGT